MTGHDPESPEHIVAHVFTALKKAAEEKIGRPVNKAFLTIPNFWTNIQKAAMQSAAQIAGLDCQGSVKEPIAIIKALSIESQEDLNVAVISLDGSEYHVAVHSVSSDGIVDYQAHSADLKLGHDLQRMTQQEIADSQEIRERLERPIENALTSADFGAEEIDQVIFYGNVIGVPGVFECLKALFDSKVEC